MHKIKTGPLPFTARYALDVLTPLDVFWMRVAI